MCVCVSPKIRIQTVQTLTNCFPLNLNFKKIRTKQFVKHKTKNFLFTFYGYLISKIKNLINKVKPTKKKTKLF